MCLSVARVTRVLCLAHWVQFAAVRHIGQNNSVFVHFSSEVRPAGFFSQQRQQSPPPSCQQSIPHHDGHRQEDDEHHGHQVDQAIVEVRV